MKKYLKNIVITCIKKYGYEIRKVKKQQRIQITKRPEGKERDKDSYDTIWANKDFVAQYGKDHSDYYSELINFIKESNILDNILSVADIGCGPGNLLSLISAHWPNIELYGFDFSSSAIKSAQDEVAAIFAQHDIYNKLDKQYDVVFCCETLEHLLHPDKALNNVLDATSKICVLTVPDGRIDKYLGHINLWTEESWIVFVNNWSAEWQVRHIRIGIKLGAILKRKVI